jgi:RimJ/RimL family protein N-acetyltransferase
VLRRHSKWERSDINYVYGVFRKSDGALLGGVDFHIIKRSHYQVANFGYHLHNRYWGQGYGREAAAKGLIIGLKDLKLHRLEAAIDIGNKRSVAYPKLVGLKDSKPWSPKK